jgi:hypothetical protein
MKKVINEERTHEGTKKCEEKEGTKEESYKQSNRAE